MYFGGSGPKLEFSNILKSPSFKLKTILSQSYCSDCDLSKKKNETTVFARSRAQVSVIHRLTLYTFLNVQEKLEARELTFPTMTGLTISPRAPQTTMIEVIVAAGVDGGTKMSLHSTTPIKHQLE